MRGQVYAALPADWRLLTEHKMYEPAFYSTVVQDWGTNLLIAQELGPTRPSASSTSATTRPT
jgi:L-rhamnose isomerase / sugar isomerase